MVLAAPAPAVLAQALAKGPAADPLAAPDCRQAMATLQAQEAAVLALRQGGQPAAKSTGGNTDAALAATRRLAATAAHACLGSSSDAPPQRLAQPPVTVLPVPVPATLFPQGQRLTLPDQPGRSALPPIAQQPALTVLTSCDRGGCWASDGSRLNRVGPSLQGAHGLCTAHGALLSCP